MPYISSFERIGFEIGYQKGLQLGFQEAIVAVLAAKFGPAGKRLKARVSEIRNVEDLRALHKASISAETLQEIRDRLPPRQA